ncbi:hypothetical protein [Streptomyces sp. ISL-100]|uniref:hypothetical protein n=1 Tax=Streptomyces sp. ISL-100 TaxID=2819173 RepID=UPI001BEB0007|nr:hypothetical protein [Streptomyces sp. ISL-100]MBT2398622.1 hypothetical protein [Streptomyces sp. ISL-100]
MAKVVQDFARFAQDQYADMVALLSALSTSLQSTGNAYVAADTASEAAQGYGLTITLLTLPVALLAVTRGGLRPWWYVPLVITGLAAWGRLTGFLPTG